MNTSGSSNRLVHTAVARRLIVVLTVALALAAGCAGPRASGGGADAGPTPGTPGHPAEGAGAAAASGPDGAPVRRSLVLLGTADLRGHADARGDESGRETDYGLARLKPLVDSVREANPGRVLLFDSGDLLAGNTLAFAPSLLSDDDGSPVEWRGEPARGGSGLALAARLRAGGAPHPVIRAMNAMGYDAAVVGDRDFCAGIAPPDRTVHDAAFPYLAANVSEAGADRDAYRPSALIPHIAARGDTIRIGVTGASSPGLHGRAPGPAGDRLEFRDVIPSVRPEVQRLREQGADLIVVLLHGAPGDPGDPGDPDRTADADDAGDAGDANAAGGGNVRDEPDATGPASGSGAARLAREVPGVDVILLGHADREPADTVVNGVLLSRAADRARSLAAVTIELTRRAPSDWSVSAREAALLRPDPARADTALLASLRRAHERGLGRLAADAQRRATGANVGITSTRAIRTLRAGLQATAVARDDLDSLLPSATELIRLHLTGGQLRTALERALAGERPDAHVSGVVAWYDPSRPSGSRILTLELDDGRPVRPNQVYTVAVHGSMADPDRDAGVFHHALRREATGIADVDALREYLEAGSAPASATAGPRLRRVDPPSGDADSASPASSDESSNR